MAATVATPPSLPQKWISALPLVAIGVACIIAGGLVAAATAPSPSEHGSWAAAYLVLVGGVAQVAFGFGQAALAPEPPSSRVIALEFIGWNLGNAGVIAGTLLDAQTLVAIGGALLVLTLAVLVWAVRGAKVATGWPTWMLWTYRVLVVIILVSVPVGLIIGQLKSN
jgi:hypothetical protein